MHIIACILQIVPDLIKDIPYKLILNCRCNRGQGLVVCLLCLEYRVDNTKRLHEFI